VFKRPDNWAKLTWQQKRDLRLNRWISGEGIKFVNKDAAKGYKARATRLAQAVKMEIPPGPKLYPPATVSFFTNGDKGSDDKEKWKNHAKLPYKMEKREPCNPCDAYQPSD
jgi:hypothetical protein